MTDPTFTNRRDMEAWAPVIYHVTPLSPRAALAEVMPTRAGGVSFFRPDDLEVLLTTCPQLFFRPRRLQLLDGSNAGGQRMGRSRPANMVAGLLRLAGTYPFCARSMGDYARQPRRAISAQRRAPKRLAIWPSWRACVAYERPHRAAGETLRASPSCLRRMDWSSQKRTCRLPGVSSKNGSCRPPDGKQLAPAAYVEGHGGRMGLSVYQCGQFELSAKWSSL